VVTGTVGTRRGRSTSTAGMASADSIATNESMPAGLRWFAEYQPFTPVIETIRGLLLGTAIGNHAIIAIAWSIGIGAASYLWARHLFNRPPITRPSVLAH
jgi:hypothetical protein